MEAMGGTWLDVSEDEAEARRNVQLELIQGPPVLTGGYELEYHFLNDRLPLGGRQAIVVPLRGTEGTYGFGILEHHRGEVFQTFSGRCSRVVVLADDHCACPPHYPPVDLLAAHED